ncbi:MAG: Ppx/GppA family phosphatase [Campylobacteraceae bacterium]|jgi:exopolyphosphatase/guanosine-5'-triphosphate,3'-diphosphate pyrophosphatase|nr:Ppx/GppA family phosphatase [Campylobacteraceae bacterium]
MAKRTAVIDIGSNSARMAIYEKESRFAFSLLNEIKSQVRISEGAYENKGNLQPFAISRALTALGEFHKIASNMKCRKLLCIATSAVRDAPNANVLINEVKKRFGFDIKIIDGSKEAYYGAVAVRNMLPRYNEATTIDIGGGSTELAKIENGTIVKTISLNIGTVRLKELFFDKKTSFDKISDFVKKEIKTVDKEFNCENLIGIGGTTRALGKLFITKSRHPLSTVHGFEYDSKWALKYIHEIASSGVLDLKRLGIKKDRYDTIREGSVIFEAFIRKLNAKKIITSGVGIREGVYLSDILRSSGAKFPHNFDLSLELLKDKFGTDKKKSQFFACHIEKLFWELKPLHKLNDCFLRPLIVAAKLDSIGRNLSFYQDHLHSAYFVLNNLNYGFTHQEKTLVSTIIKFYNKKVTQNNIFLYEKLLPPLSELNWLIFIFSLVKIFQDRGAIKPLSFVFSNGSLHIKSTESLYLTKEPVKKIFKPEVFSIVIDDNQQFSIPYR